MTSTNRIVSGMRPTGALHIGHYFGVLVNWKKLQKDYNCYFFVADWHAMTSEYTAPQKINTHILELTKDWLAAGLDPEKCLLYQQSRLHQIAELHLVLSMIAPLGWLERCPTYKDMKEQLAAKDLNTYGFLGYPVLQTADIIMFRPQSVPVGEDQVPHLELCREITRRFNSLYCGETPFFPEPQAMLTKESRLPGLDGRKMSKSYGNTIGLGEDFSLVRPKVMSMLTDTNRLRKADSGDPARCNLYPYHALLTEKENLPEIQAGCKDASLGCVDCKKLLMHSLEVFLAPIHERRQEYDKSEDLVWDILRTGSEKAKSEADKTLEAVHRYLGF